MAPKKETTLGSKQWSCSELKDGSTHLMRVKKESGGEDDLKNKIKDPAKDA